MRTIKEVFEQDQRIYHEQMNIWFNRLLGIKCNCIFCIRKEQDGS